MYFLQVFVSFDYDAVAILLFDETLSKIDHVKLVPQILHHVVLLNP